MLEELKKLQSGTDIRGIAIEHEGNKTLTPELMKVLGLAL